MVKAWNAYTYHNTNDNILIMTFPTASRIRANKYFLQFQYSWYGLKQSAVVMGSMPGYKPKSTSIWLEETATADFILDPDSALKDNTPRSICDCSYDSKAKLVLLEFLLGFHMEVCFVLIVIGALLCFLLKRRLKFTLGKQKQSPKRSVVV